MVWNINPVALSFGAVQLHWYGLFFAGGLLGAYFFGEWIFANEGKDKKLLEPYFVYLIIGITLGARLFHVFFYDFGYFSKHPIEILMVWRGGLASHGGAIGAVVATYLFCKKYKINFAWMLSRVAMATMIVVGSIRVGNFFNSEIVGLPTKSLFGVVFARVDNIARHPVVLYEAVAYFAIFALLFWLYKRVSSQKFTNIAAGLVLILAFIARFVLEYFKTSQSEFANALPLSMGQLLSLPFIFVGVYLLIASKKQSH